MADPKPQKVKLRRPRPEAGGFHSGRMQYRISEWPAGVELPPNAEALEGDPDAMPEGEWIDEEAPAKEAQS